MNLTQMFVALEQIVRSKTISLFVRVPEVSTLKEIKDYTIHFVWSKTHTDYRLGRVAGAGADPPLLKNEYIFS